MLAAADKRIYLPMFGTYIKMTITKDCGNFNCSVVGFTESLNLSVASALVIQQLFYICPEARGNLCVKFNGSQVESTKLIIF